MYPLLFFMMAIALTVGTIPCLLLWNLGKRLPVWWRLLPITFLMAVALTPVGGGSEGGPWVSTLGLQLPFAWFVSKGPNNINQLLSSDAVILALEIWTCLYTLWVVAIAIRRTISRRAQHVS